MSSKVDILHIIRSHKISFFLSVLPAFTIGVAKLDSHFFSFLTTLRVEYCAYFEFLSKTQNLNLCKVCPQKLEILHINKCHKICLLFCFLPAFTIDVANLDSHFFSFFDHSQSRILCIFWVFKQNKNHSLRRYVLKSRHFTHH